MYWGGIGFSASNDRLSSDFAHTLRGLDLGGGMGLLSKGLTTAINESYPGDKLYADHLQLIELDEVDQGLVFMVSIDKEFVTYIPSEIHPGKYHITAYVFATAQVISLNAAEKTVNVLDSFPFRVSRSGGNLSRSNEDVAKVFKEAIFDSESGLIAFFKQKIAKRSYKETFVRQSVKLGSINIDDASVASYKKAGASAVLDEEFWAGALLGSLSSSLPMNTSVMPYRVNDALAQGLAARFKTNSGWNLIFTTGQHEADWTVDIKLSKALKKNVGSSPSAFLYARGMSVFISIKDGFGREKFTKKFVKTANTEVSKEYVDMLPMYDQNYFTQLAIALVDENSPELGAIMSA